MDNLEDKLMEFWHLNYGRSFYYENCKL